MGMAEEAIGMREDMCHSIRRILAALVLTLGLSGTVAAGPLEDAMATYDRGDYQSALRLLYPLADQGNSTAQFTLGSTYDFGWGVPQDWSEAVRWYRMAANQNHPAAQLNLGVMYQEGRGVPRDYVQAHMWLNLAAARATRVRGFAEAREDVARMMTSAQIAQAQKMAREWKPTAAPAEAGNLQK